MLTFGTWVGFSFDRAVLHQQIKRKTAKMLFYYFMKGVGRSESNVSTKQEVP
jgi:hypothetical protein